MIVELRYASIPSYRLFADHYWFVTRDCTSCDRWEIWHDASLTPLSRGYLHRNLLRPYSSVGGGPAQRATFWSGEDAERLTKTLWMSWDTYPYRFTYRALPGPNSNTYVAWILQEAQIRYPLSRRALGKSYLNRKKAAS